MLHTHITNAANSAKIEFLRLDYNLHHPEISSLSYICQSWTESSVV